MRPEIDKFQSGAIHWTEQAQIYYARRKQPCAGEEGDRAERGIDDAPRRIDPLWMNNKSENVARGLREGRAEAWRVSTTPTPSASGGPSCASWVRTRRCGGRGAGDVSGGGALGRRLRYSRGPLGCGYGASPGSRSRCTIARRNATIACARPAVGSFPATVESPLPSGRKRRPSRTARRRRASHARPRHADRVAPRIRNRADCQVSRRRIGGRYCPSGAQHGDGGGARGWLARQAFRQLLLRYSVFAGDKGPT